MGLGVYARFLFLGESFKKKHDGLDDGQLTLFLYIFFISFVYGATATGTANLRI